MCSNKNNKNNNNGNNDYDDGYYNISIIIIIMIIFINISKGYTLQMEYKMNTDKSHSCYMSENTI